MIRHGVLPLAIATMALSIIMKEGATLVFVEVRKRGSQRFGGAIASIGTHKQAKLRRAIGLYLATVRSTPACRVDAMLFDANGTPVWEKNIFGA